MNNREIKFRAWVKPKGKMIQVYGFNEDFVFENTLDGPFKDGENQNIFKRSDCELMQYTGKKDKNGKEIYEGDIVEFLDGERMFVNRNSIYLCYCLYTGKKTEYFDEYQCDGNINNFEPFLVIGNIYETPEKLKNFTP